MGMYTQLVMACSVKNNPEAVHVLKFLIDPHDDKFEVPDHPFFRTDRWRWLFVMSSHYFTPSTSQKFEYNEVAEAWSLITCSNLKNYDNEIEKFIDWISPYLSDSEEMVGYYRYEEDREPTIIYAP